MMFAACSACEPEPVDVGAGAAAGAEVGAEVVPARDGPPDRNILLVIADDLGVDKVGVYARQDYPNYAAVAETLPETPNIDGLAEAGVRFTRAWSNPTCSPTRAGVYTGRHAFRTGVGRPVGGEHRPVQAPDEVTLAELLAGGQTPHTSGLFGKWHLGTSEDRPDELTDDAPRDQGWHSHRGAYGTGLPSYYAWTKVQDGVVRPALVRDYITFVAVEDALEWIGGRTRPWFATLAFNAPHTTSGRGEDYETPPMSCLERGEVGRGRAARYRAVVECMDHQVGALLAGLPDDTLARTTVIFAGDNGTDPAVMEGSFPLRGGKGSVYEGGVRVPLIIADGRHLVGGEATDAPGGVTDPGRSSDALVHTTDLFATIGHIAGRAPVAEDAVSLAPLMAGVEAGWARTLYTEKFDVETTPTGREILLGMLAARGERFKVTVRVGYPWDPCAEPFRYTPYALFDLRDDPGEAVNLLEGAPTPETEEALERLMDEVEAMHTGWVEATCGAARSAR